MNEREFWEFVIEQSENVANAREKRRGSPLTITKQLYEQLVPQLMEEFRQKVIYMGNRIR